MTLGWTRLTPQSFEDLVQRASRRYRPSGITAWQFARGKLKGDPLYRAVWEQTALRESGTLIDVGCGQGLMLALLAEDEKSRTTLTRTEPGRHPGETPAPRTLIGVETRPRIARIAQDALGSDATILSGDARLTPLPASRTILVFDVLHMMPAADQESLLRALAACLEVGGTLLIREADAQAGWKFNCVKFGNRFKGLINGYSTRAFHFRSGTEWLTLLRSLGLSAKSQPMGQGTPFGNLLLSAVKLPPAE